MSEVLLFKADDPEFQCDSQEQYQILMNWLFNKTVELSGEYPDNPVLVVYVV